MFLVHEILLQFEEQSISKPSIKLRVWLSNNVVAYFWVEAKFQLLSRLEQKIEIRCCAKINFAVATHKRYN